MIEQLLDMANNEQYNIVRITQYADGQVSVDFFVDGEVCTYEKEDDESIQELIGDAIKRELERVAR